MKQFGKVAVLMGGRAGLGTVERLVRAGARGRSGEDFAMEWGG